MGILNLPTLKLSAPGASIGASMILVALAFGCSDGGTSTFPGRDGGSTVMPGTDGGTTVIPGTDGGTTVIPGTDGGSIPIPPATALRLVMAVDVSGTTGDYATVVELGLDGMLTETTAHVDLESSPRGIAVSTDGSTALVSHGLGPAANEGVAVLALNASGLSLVEDVAFGSEYSPSGVGFVGAQEAMVGLFGPAGGALRPISSADGSHYTAGTSFEFTPSPQKIVALDADHALVFGSNSLTDDAALQVLGRSGGSWELRGSKVPVADTFLDAAVHVAGQRAYVCLFDPTDPPSPSPGGPPRRGVIHTFAATGGVESWAAVGSGVVVPHHGHFIAVSADGTKGVLLTTDQSNHRYGLTQLSFEATGVPAAPSAPVTYMDGTLGQDVVYTASGFVVVSMSTPNVLVVFSPNSDGSFTEVDRIDLDGSVREIGVAPAASDVR